MRRRNLKDQNFRARVTLVNQTQEHDIADDEERGFATRIADDDDEASEPNGAGTKPRLAHRSSLADVPLLLTKANVQLLSITGGEPLSMLDSQRWLASVADGIPIGEPSPIKPARKSTSPQRLITPLPARPTDTLVCHRKPFVCTVPVCDVA